MQSSSKHITEVSQRELDSSKKFTQDPFLPVEDVLECTHRIQLFFTPSSFHEMSTSADSWSVAQKASLVASRPHQVVSMTQYLEGRSCSCLLPL